MHWTDNRCGNRLTVELDVAILDTLACIPVDVAVAAADSAFRRSGALRRRWNGVIAAAPERARQALGFVDGICESGTETLFWLRTQPLSIRRQVVVPGVGRVDFLVGERLVVEVDGAAYHAGTAQFERDRARDAALSTRGFRVLRFSYWQVMERWLEVQTALQASIARGDHL